VAVPRTRRCFHRRACFLNTWLPLRVSPFCFSPFFPPLTRGIIIGSFHGTLHCPSLTPLDFFLQFMSPLVPLVRIFMTYLAPSSPFWHQRNMRFFFGARNTPFHPTDQSKDESPIFKVEPFFPVGFSGGQEGLTGKALFPCPCPERRLVHITRSWAFPPVLQMTKAGVPCQPPVLTF